MKTLPFLTLLAATLLPTCLYANNRSGWVWPIEDTYNWRFFYEAGDGLAYAMRGDGQWMRSTDLLDWQPVDGHPGTLEGNGVSVLPFYSHQRVPDHQPTSLYPVRLEADGQVERIFMGTDDPSMESPGPFPEPLFHEGHWWWGSLFFKHGPGDTGYVLTVWNSLDTRQWAEVLTVRPNQDLGISGPIWDAELLVHGGRLQVRLSTGIGLERRTVLMSVDPENPELEEVDWPAGELFAFQDQLYAGQGNQIKEAETGTVVAELAQVPYTTYEAAGGLVVPDPEFPGNDLVLIPAADEPLATLVEIAGGDFVEQFPLPLTGGILDLCEGTGGYVMVGTQGEVLYSEDGLEWATTDLQVPVPATIDSANGEFRIVTDTAVYASTDGRDWAQLERPLPVGAARFSPHGFGELVESDEALWLYQPDGDWEALKMTRGEGPVFYIPELQLIISQSKEHQWFDTIRGGEFHSSYNRLSFFSNTFQWDYLVAGTAFGTGIGSYAPIPPLDHRLITALDYGNGRFHADQLLGHDLYEPFIVDPEAHFHEDIYATTALKAYRPKSVRFTGNRFVVTQGSGMILNPNPDGPDYPPVLTERDAIISVTDRIPPRPVTTGFLVQEGWVGSDWFDWCSTKYYPWLYKWDLGWVYTYGGSDSHAWYWDTHIGPFWTSRHFFPTVYTESEGWFRHPKARYR